MLDPRIINSMIAVITKSFTTDQELIDFIIQIESQKRSCDFTVSLRDRLNSIISQRSCE